jgi:hypothetical protein
MKQLPFFLYTIDNSHFRRRSWKVYLLLFAEISYVSFVFLAKTPTIIITD